MKPNLKTRGYQADAYVASFAGFFPSERPRLAIIAVIDEPKTSIYGGAVAAPLFAEAALFAGQHFRIPPSTGSEVRVAAASPNEVFVKNPEMRAVERAGTWQGATIRRAATAARTHSLTIVDPLPSPGQPPSRRPSLKAAGKAPALRAKSSAKPESLPDASASTVPPPATVPPSTVAPTTTTATIPDVSRRGKEAPLQPRATVAVPKPGTASRSDSPALSEEGAVVSESPANGRTAAGADTITAVQ